MLNLHNKNDIQNKIVTIIQKKYKLKIFVMLLLIKPHLKKRFFSRKKRIKVRL